MLGAVWTFLKTNRIVGYLVSGLVFIGSIAVMLLGSLFRAKSSDKTDAADTREQVKLDKEEREKSDEEAIDDFADDFTNR